MTVAEVAVRKRITVDVPIAAAFDLFTAGIDRWWIREHHLGQAELGRVVLEGREGGRWYEIGVDGSECEWGHVRCWEPPNRLVLAWQIDGSWRFDPDLVTEVEVRFVADGPDRTRVELEHRNLDRLGAAQAEARAGLDSPGGWQGLLVAYSQAAAGGG